MTWKTGTTQWKTRVNKTAPKTTPAPRKRATRAKNVPDKASLSVTTTLTQGGSTQHGTNQLFVNRSTNLAMFPRAQGVAQHYQHFRIKKLTMVFKPNVDTFAAVGGGYQKINFYYMIDKGGSVPANISLEGLKQMGAKPRAMDEKPITVSWRPSVRTLEQSQLGAGEASAYKISPWLNTNKNGAGPGVFQPNGIEHWGIYFYAEQQGDRAAYGVEITAEFEFKKPVYTALLSETEAIQVKPAVIDTSSNGIVDDIA